MAARKPLVIVAGSVQELPTGDTVVGSGDVTLTGTQTLTNKTLTTPVINGFSGTGNGTVTGNLTVSGNTTLGDSAADTVTINASRITGDFSNATLVNRLHLQTSTLNAVTSVGILPNGTAQTAQINVENNSDPANGQYAQFVIGGSSIYLTSNARGASIGNALPISINMAGVIAATFNANGTTSGLKVTELNGGPLAGFRNRIINGSFDVWQRGTSVTLTANLPAYTADQFRVYSAGAGVSVLKDTVSFNTPHAVIIGVASNTLCNAGFAIESANIDDLAEGPVTFSYEIHSNTARLVGYNSVYFNTKDSGLSAFTGGPGNGSLLTTALSTWQKVSVSIASLPAGFKNGGYFAAHLGAVTAGQTVRVRNFQLELGSVATPFEFRPYSVELALCQRYAFDPYYNVSSANVAVGKAFIDPVITTTFLADIQFPVTMRAAPTLVAPTAASFSLGYPYYLAISTISISIASPNAAVLSGTCAVGTVNLNYHLYRPGTTEKLLFVSEL